MAEMNVVTVLPRFQSPLCITLTHPLPPLPVQWGGMRSLSSSNPGANNPAQEPELQGGTR